MTLPGAMLPFLLMHWSMSDARAGMVLFLFFIGTTFGALLARGKLNLSIARGSLAIAAGAIALALASRIVAFPAIFLYGTGSGVVMTSISLLQSRRYPDTRTAAMARLNLMWSIGALAGPAIALEGGAKLGQQMILYSTASLFFLGAVLTLLFVSHAQAPVAIAVWHKAKTVPILLLLLLPLATGIESSMGGWLATYSRRTGETLGFTIGAVTCFWAGMLLSRFLQSYFWLTGKPADNFLTINPIIMGIAMATMIGWPGTYITPVASLALGLGIGPLYALIFSKVLRYGEHKNVAFVFAGCGASFLPMLTGFISTRTNSLRAGLFVPLICTIAVACLGWIIAAQRSTLEMTANTTPD